ncbi:MAG: D-tagatose-bisphosphate aldolase, class II, non-catalytic subunit [Pseudoalteromonas nigrifaciens]
MNEMIESMLNNKKGIPSGIYSVCCAHPLVIEAALLQGLADDSPVLIEATANQVNQFGGYTNMLPADFVSFVHDIAVKVNYPTDRIILGGDHLGPTCWTKEPAAEAMEKSKKLIETYVAAGFKKIHLDTSMQCADDTLPLSDETVAKRAAMLCQVAEQTAIRQFGKSDIIYIVGTEVPPPGGAKEEIDTLEVTPVENVNETLSVHAKIFAEQGLHDAWSRVIGLVVQPGVEFDNFTVFEYDSSKAQALKNFAANTAGLVFEAHSTDYQPAEAYKALVRDHFAILKVGPQLTFALREALFALSFIEQELVAPDAQSHLREVCEQVMLNEKGGWESFYPQDQQNLAVYRRYSFSDRIRYYWNNEQIQTAVTKLFANLSAIDMPLPLISQFMPSQYDAVIAKKLDNAPKALVLNKVMQVTQLYADACYFQTKQRVK